MNISFYLSLAQEYPGNDFNLPISLAEITIRMTSYHCIPERIFRADVQLILVFTLGWQRLPKGENLNTSSFLPSEMEIIAPAQAILNLHALQQQVGHSFARCWH